MKGIMLILLSGILSIQTSCNNREDKPSDAELHRIAYESAATGKERDYFLYLPQDYHSQPEKKWPVMLFLHGNGERGDGKEELDYVLIHGPLYEAWIQKRDLPFIMIVPQLPMYGMDEEADYLKNRSRESIPARLDEGVPDRPDEFPTPEEMTGSPAANTIYLPPEGPQAGWFMLEDELIAMIDRTLADYRGDASRVYLTGISYGGFGSWFLASKHPDRFSAIAPVVGFGHPGLMQPIAEHQVPVWSFAGGRDPVVPVQFFYPGLNELEKLGHENVLFTVHEDMGHDAWKRIYAGSDLYNWMLLHKKE